ncbi:MAG: nitroreductase family protein [Erysipelotrichaceae bacterium]|nr:nitroreductase family protein [Erysipelotrichaceae bacterium]
MSLDAIRNRRSVRSFDGKALSSEDLEKIRTFAENVKNPYGIDIEWHFLSKEKDVLSVPVISGCDTFIAGKMKKQKHAEEAFGFTFERIVLFATDLGIGTTWIAGTMDRKGFEKAIGLKEDEVMPCISPLGYPAEKMSLKEIAMRKAIRADKRLDPAELFFEKDMATPYEGQDSLMKELLEMVRLAPSAVNRQPWRLLVDGDTVCFYKKGDQTGDLDIRKIDIGIAISHFTLGLEEKGIGYDYICEELPAMKKDGHEFIAAVRLRKE